MKSDLWFVFAITAGFLGFLIGYGVPPMAEVGIGAMGGHGGTAVENTTESDAAMDQFKDLEKLLE
ncbi:MAG: hypothetical protein GY794_05600 [bacterium]|nr:hypothetical protein [bacterium]